MNSDESASANIEWGRWVVVVAGALLLLLGVRRFILAHHFGLMDALFCCLAIIPASLLLLVFDYVLHHARLVLPIPLIVAGVFVLRAPAFEIALGLTLIGAVVAPALRDWKAENRRQHV
jgi:hypothetical protein